MTKGKVVGPDEYLVKIKEEQAAPFENLQSSLDAMTTGEQNAASQVRGAVSEIRNLNSSLVARLQMTNAENERLAEFPMCPGDRHDPDP